MKHLRIITLKRTTKSTGTALLKNSSHFMTKDCKKKSKILPTYKMPKRNKNSHKLKEIPTMTNHKKKILIKRKHSKLCNFTLTPKKKKIFPIRDVLKLPTPKEKGTLNNQSLIKCSKKLILILIKFNCSKKIFSKKLLKNLFPRIKAKNQLKEKETSLLV